MTARKWLACGYAPTECAVSRCIRLDVSGQLIIRLRGRILFDSATVLLALLALQKTKALPRSSGRHRIRHYSHRRTLNSSKPGVCSKSVELRLIAWVRRWLWDPDSWFRLHWASVGLNHTLSNFRHGGFTPVLRDRWWLCPSMDILLMA